MPSKAQRAASRQARLSRRRRRGKGAPQNFQSGPTTRLADGESDSDEQARSIRRTPAFSGAAAAPSVAVAQPTLRPRRRSADSGTSQVGRYLGRELRQIGFITSLIAVILVGLTFVLG